MIQEKDFLYRVPVKTAPITTPGGQIRNPEILVDVEGGEFMHGNILDANSTNKLINQSVKDAVDNKLIESGYVTKDLLEAETTRATEQENSLKTLIGAETSARTKGDEDLSSKIKAEQTRAEGKEKEISDKLAIVDGDSNTEGSFRKAIADVIAAAPEDLDTLKEIADKLTDNDDLHTALNQAITDKADASALLNEVTRATGVESGLQAAIATKADATALSNYVLTTALNQQVDTLNTAINAKQDAGSYIPYDASVQGIYQIDKGFRISSNDAVVMVQPLSFYSKNGDSTIDINSSGIYIKDGDNNIRLGRSGVVLPDGSSNYVLTSAGSTINIAEYATKSDLSSQLGPKADRSDLIALEKKITANTTAIEGKQDKGNYMEYSSKDDDGYTINCELNTSEPITVDEGSGFRAFVNQSGITANDDNNNKSSQLSASSLTFAALTNSGVISTIYTINGIIANKYTNCLATSDGSFKPIYDFVLKEDEGLEYVSYDQFSDQIDSVKAGLSSKQNKITVNSVDVTNIETADITQLRAIVNDLLTALDNSGLIKCSSGVE